MACRTSAPCVELGRRRRAVVVADHPPPDRAVTRVGERVHPDAAIERGERPGDVGRAPAVDPDRHRGDALVEERQRVAPPVLRQLGVRVHVDEAGRHHQPVDVDDHGGVEAGRRRVADEADAVARHADVLPDRRLSRAVVDEAADQQKVRRRLPSKIADRQGGHRHGGQEPPVPLATITVGPDRHDAIPTNATRSIRAALTALTATTGLCSKAPTGWRQGSLLAPDRLTRPSVKPAQGHRPRQHADHRARRDRQCSRRIRPAPRGFSATPRCAACARRATSGLGSPGPGPGAQSRADSG